MPLDQFEARVGPVPDVLELGEMVRDAKKVRPHLRAFQIGQDKRSRFAIYAQLDDVVFVMHPFGEKRYRVLTVLTTHGSCWEVFI